jgi:hypothetical protein
VHWKREPGFKLSLELPAGVTARVELPAREGARGVFVGGKPVGALRAGGRWILQEDVAGAVTIEER